MTTSLLHNTKSKIANVAKKLFSKNGLNGTSVRQIANAAQVNISAINYHFKNKDNLYNEIFHIEYAKISNGIENLYSSCQNLDDLSYSTFNYLNKNSQTLLFLFHSFLNMDLDPNDICAKDIRHIGPIGSKTFLKQIDDDLKKLGLEISVDQKMWAIRVILTSIIHHSIGLQSPLLKKINGKVPYLHPSKKEESIRNISTAIFNFMAQS